MVEIYNLYKALSQGMVFNIIQEIIISNKSIIIHWITGHCGIVHNEFMDRLAKGAILNGIELTDLHIPYDDFKALQKISHYNTVQKSYLNDRYSSMV